MRGLRPLVRTLVAGLAFLAAGELPAAPLAGQQMEETRLLRLAAAQESRGELEAAEATLRTLLESQPTSAAGLFALERVLRARGELVELLPAVDAFLAEGPDVSGIRHLKLRVLADVDSTEALRAVADAWFARDPADPEPYREVSRLWSRVLGPEEALEVLRRGREAVGIPHVLALETGDLLADLGRTDEAAEEWARGLAADPGLDAAVARRLAELADPAGAARRVVAHLAAEGVADVPRLRAAARIAVALGLEEEAMAAARTVSEEAEGRVRAGFLADLARRADDRALPEVAAWAWEELGAEAASTGERRRFDQRLVEASLAAGDTATALEAQRRLAASFTEGTPDRRQAMAGVIRLESGHAEPGRLRGLLRSFRDAFPDAPELDDLAAMVADRLLARGDVSGAATVLEGIDGPRSNLMRGWILMERGDVALGRQALLMAVPELPPAEATGLIQLAGLLGRLSPPGVALLSRAAVQARQGEVEAAADGVEEGLESLPAEERAPLLAEAARMVDQAAPGRAAELRRRIVEEHPDAGEAAEAALELARTLARRPGGREEAVALLEELITSRPGAAVVPTARRELERLRGSGS